MAKITGKNGIIKLDDAQVLQSRSWNLDRTGDTVEDTVIGDLDRTFKATLRSASGGVEFYYDDEDIAVFTLEVGDSVSMELYPDGDAEGDNFWEFEAIITALNTSGSFDGMVDGTLSYQATGAVTLTTVPTP